MAFVDEIHIPVRAGDGGDGVVRWLHLKGKEFGGPSGGDGGNGGNVIVRGVRDLMVLARYQGVSEIRAENGEHGSKNEMTGANGKDVYIDVPVGSLIFENDICIGDVVREGAEIVVAIGGAGGVGNARFKSSTNQYPTEATPGAPGERRLIRVELRLIADAGIVGLPNAGKSSLLNVLTKARSRVAAYPFTTLEPHLGVFHRYILADIPGLIEGASEGKGLGHKFLKHITRTKCIIHCISAEHENPSRIHENLRKELGAYDASLLQKPEIIFLTKADEVGEGELGERTRELSKWSAVVPFSILDDALMKKGEAALAAFLKEHE